MEDRQLESNEESKSNDRQRQDDIFPHRAQPDKEILNTAGLFRRQSGVANDSVSLYRLCKYPYNGTSHWLVAVDENTGTGER